MPLTKVNTSGETRIKGNLLPEHRVTCVGTDN